MIGLYIALKKEVNMPLSLPTLITGHGEWMKQVWYKDRHGYFPHFSDVVREAGHFPYFTSPSFPLTIQLS